jgi:hypothetical protein
MRRRMRLTWYPWGEIYQLLVYSSKFCMRTSLTVYRIPLTVMLSTYPWPATVATKARSNLKDNIGALLSLEV